MLHPLECASQAPLVRLVKADSLTILNGVVRGVHSIVTRTAPHLFPKTMQAISPRSYWFFQNSVTCSSRKRNQEVSSGQLTEQLYTAFQRLDRLSRIIQSTSALGFDSPSQALVPILPVVHVIPLEPPLNSRECV